MLDDLLIKEMRSHYEVIIPKHIPGFVQPAWESKTCPPPNFVDESGAHYIGDNVFAFQQSINRNLSLLWNSPRILEINRWFHLLDFIRFELNKHVGEIAITILQRQEETHLLVSRYFRVFTSHTYWDGMKLVVVIDKKGVSKSFKTVYHEIFDDNKAYAYSFFEIPEEVSSELALMDKDQIKCYIKVDGNEPFPFSHFNEMDDNVSQLFRRFYEAYRSLDVDRTAQVFGEEVISAGPQGAVVVSRDDLIKSTENVMDLFRKAGRISASILSMEEFPIDDNYSMVSVIWGDVYEKKPEVTLPYRVSYIVEKIGEPSIVMQFIHEERRKVLKEHGLI